MVFLIIPLFLRQLLQPAVETSEDEKKVKKKIKDLPHNF